MRILNNLSSTVSIRSVLANLTANKIGRYEHEPSDIFLKILGIRTHLTVLVAKKNIFKFYKSMNIVPKIKTINTFAYLHLTTHR